MTAVMAVMWAAFGVVYLALYGVAVHRGDTEVPVNVALYAGLSGIVAAVGWWSR